MKGRLKGRPFLILAADMCRIISKTGELTFAKTRDIPERAKQGDWVEQQSFSEKEQTELVHRRHFWPEKVVNNSWLQNENCIDLKDCLRGRQVFHGRISVNKLCISIHCRK
jgi:hypothetical protein